MAFEIYVIVSIQNTYVWIAPENRSKYTCSAAGHITASFPKMPYTSVIIIVPESTFANRRSDSDTGTANSLITLIGNQIGSQGGSGEHMSFQISFGF